MRYKYSLVLCL